MNLSKSIKDKIKAWEGCRLVGYRCPAGVPTIGYGHTGPEVKIGQRITQAQADEYFERDIARFSVLMMDALRNVKMKGCQFDALTSLAYNIGVGNFKSSTLLKKVKADADDPSIRQEFARWINAGGRVLPGLVKRRAEEANHYFGKI